MYYFQTEKLKNFIKINYANKGEIYPSHIRKIPKSAMSEEALSLAFQPSLSICT